MTNNKEDVLRFEDFEINTQQEELRKAGKLIPVEPQVLDLLSYLAKHPDQLITHDDLIENVWKGRIVSNSAIASCISEARSAVDDDGKQQRIIKTIPRRGIRFVSQSSFIKLEPALQQDSTSDNPAIEIQVASPLEMTKPTETQPFVPNTPSNRPSIVVLPFTNLSSDEEQSFFSDGIADDITTDLSRYEELFVIARHSAFAFHGKEQSSLEFAQQLHVDFALEGSVRRHEKTARISVNLIEVSSQKTVWGERYDRDLHDILEVQTEIATVIVNTLVGRIVYRQLSKIQLSSESAFNAYELTLKAQQLIWSYSKTDVAKAREHAEAAIKLEPRYARAHAVLSWVHHTQGSNGWGDDPDFPFDKAVEHGKAAVNADYNEPWGHCTLAFALVWHEQDYRRGLDEARIAVQQNPSNAHFRMLIGATLAYMGRGNEAATEIETAIQLNPLHPAFYLIHYARAHFVEAHYEEALPLIERATLAMPSHSNALALLAGCYAALERHDEARRVCDEIASSNPVFTVSYIRKILPFARQEDMDFLCSLLIGAGLPE